MKVLIAAPIAGTKQYSLNIWLQWIADNSHADFEICLCANGKEKKELIEKLKQIEITTIHGDNKKILLMQLENDENLTTIQRITYSREKIRRLAVKQEFDYLFFLDTDTIPVYDNAITQILSRPELKNSAISGLYFYKNSRQTVAIDLKTKTNLALHKIQKAHEHKELIEVWGFGFGCLMLSKNIFKENPFDYEKFKEHYTDDFGYCQILEDNNIQRFIDPLVLCRHFGTINFQKLSELTKIPFKDGV